jgi:hypothetical protein
MFAPARYRPWLRPLLAAGAVALFALGYLWGNQTQLGRTRPPAFGGVLTVPPRPVPEFELQDTQGRIFDRRSLSAGWTLLAFADLSRPSGQSAVRRLIELYNRVSDRESLHRGLRLALATLSDTPDQARALAALSPALHVLGGDASEIRRLADALGADAKISDAPMADAPIADSGDPTAIFVFAPGGALVALLAGDRDGAGMASDLVALYEHTVLPLPE